MNHLPTLAQGAVEDLCRAFNIAPEIAALAVMTSIATGAQLCHDAVLPSGEVWPIAIHTTVVTESSGWGADMLNQAFAPFIEDSAQAAAPNESNRPTWEHSIWLRARAQLIQQIAIAQLFKACTNDLQQRLEKHLANDPNRKVPISIVLHNAPSIPSPHLSDAKNVFLILHHDADANLEMATAESVGNFGGWRGSTKTATDTNTRVGTMIVISAAHFRQTKASCDTENDRTDFFHPLAYPEASTLHCTTPPTKNMYRLAALHDFLKTQVEIYREEQKNGSDIPRIPVIFDSDAKCAIEEFQERLRHNVYLKELGFEDNTIIEQAVRHACQIAAAFEVLEGNGTTVTAVRMLSAIAIVNWHIQELIRISSPECAISKVATDAEVVEEFLRSNFWSQKSKPSRAEAQKALRTFSKSRFDLALNYLIREQRVINAPVARGRMVLTPPYNEQLLDNSTDASLTDG